MTLIPLQSVFIKTSFLQSRHASNARAPPKNCFSVAQLPLLLSPNIVRTKQHSKRKSIRCSGVKCTSMCKATFPQGIFFYKCICPISSCAFNWDRKKSCANFLLQQVTSFAQFLIRIQPTLSLSQNLKSQCLPQRFIEN